MIPYILAAVGGYLIGDSLKGKQYAEGGRIWSEIRSDFEDDGFVYIDAYTTEDENEEGKVIAKVKENGEVIYLDKRAKTDAFAQEVIEEVKSRIGDGKQYSKGGYMAGGGMIFKKGEKVILKDGGGQRIATIVQDGYDSRNRVRVRPDGFPMDISVPMEEKYSDDKRVYVLRKMAEGGGMMAKGVVNRSNKNSK